MNYPELNIGDLDPNSGLDSLPEEGHAKIHYKITSRGKHTPKHGPDKGKEKHSATLEVHHITPEGGSGQKESEQDTVRKKAKSFFNEEDEKAKAPKEAQEPDSMMPG
jgi:hypothetical protein